MFALFEVQQLRLVPPELCVDFSNLATDRGSRLTQLNSAKLERPSHWSPSVNEECR